MPKTNLNRRCEIESELHRGDRTEPAGWWDVRGKRYQLSAELVQLEKLPAHEAWEDADMG